MKFETTPLAGAYVVRPEPACDERGMFARSFCQREFAQLGLDTTIAQCNVSFSKRRGTLRGLHYQAAPHEEAKLVRCTRGTVWDVIVDLRPTSVTCYRWFATELSAENRVAVYVPRGFAHGFQTLTDDSEVFYQMSEFYHAELTGGVRWDDPTIAIQWPLPEPILSERDRNNPLVGPP